jgi:glyoxylase-like metal-dependent hydrolase (beta-lactamase superfamily II)
MYLIDTDEGITLIDAGLPGHYRDLQEQLERLGKTPADIKGLILTHGDLDHIGFAEKLRREHGVPVYVHAADADLARTGRRGKLPLLGKLRPGPTLRLIAHALRKSVLLTRHVKQVELVADGDVLALPGAPVIVALPGHTPGSIGVHLAFTDAVLVGDALTTRHQLTGRIGPQLAGFTRDRVTAAASLHRLAELEATWVLPGHGAPWPDGTAKAVAAAL